MKESTSFYENIKNYLAKTPIPKDKDYAFLLKPR